MPLIILGLLFIIGIVAYWFFNSYGSDELPPDARSLREHYSNAAQDKAREVAEDVKGEVMRRIRKRAGIHEVDYTVEDDGYGESGSDASTDNTIHFPSDVEDEKRKRDIH